ncbi:MAG: hypothetical protein KGI50_02075 [Patescibacteria group bacterium]|nr:hypothetical protein [Patescibacteria group bacterium]MDE2437867.1 hypothetical protein [Patescibacteria group bacterium]
MYTIKALVIESSLPDPILIYYAKEDLSRGSLVVVPLRNKLVPAFVMESSPLLDRKLSIKQAGYSLQRVTRVITYAPIISPRQKIFFERLSFYYHVSIPSLLKFLLPPIQKTFLHFPIVQPKTDRITPHVFSIVFRSVHDSPYMIDDALLQRLSEEGGQHCIIFPTHAILSETLARLAPSQHIVAYKKSMKAKEVRELWIRILQGEPVVVLGLPSALYLPWQYLCSVHVAHASRELYNSSSFPFIDGVRAAREAGMIYNARVVLLDVLPRVGWGLSNHEGSRFALPTITLFTEHSIPSWHMPQERPLWPDVMRNAIIQKRDSAKKILIFVNRRGYIPLVACASCGYTYACPKCSAGFTLHKEKGALLLRCHRCGYEEVSPHDVCPLCHGFFTRWYGAGTARVIQESLQLFPGYTHVQFDSDVAHTNLQEEKLLDTFLYAEHAVLVTTELLFKHILPASDLTLVVDVDRMMNIPDFSTEERMVYRLSALGMRSRCCMISTHNPDRAVFRALTDPSQFFEDELANRKRYEFPPYCEIVRVTYAHKDKRRVQELLVHIANDMRKVLTKIQKEHEFEIIDPFPAYVERIHNRYQYHLLVKMKKNICERTDADIAARNTLLRTIPQGCTIIIEPPSIF